MRVLHGSLRSYFGAKSTQSKPLLRTALCCRVKLLRLINESKLFWPEEIIISAGEILSSDNWKYILYRKRYHGTLRYAESPGYCRS